MNLFDLPIFVEKDVLLISNDNPSLNTDFVVHQFSKAYSPSDMLVALHALIITNDYSLLVACKTVCINHCLKLVEAIIKARGPKEIRVKHCQMCSK